jgi:hypothetical protein
MDKYLTPHTLPSEVICRRIEIPNSREWLGIFNAAVLTLIYSWAWEQVHETDMSPEECAAICYDIYEKYLNSGGECALVPSPYWDISSSADDELPSDIQPWYGVVTDFLAPIDELNFVENAAVWVITGFVAYAAGIGAAVYFRTVARRFVIAVERQDIGEIIRVVVDSSEYRIDTTPYAEGEIIEVDVVTTAETLEHDIYVINAGAA